MRHADYVVTHYTGFPPTVNGQIVDVPQGMTSEDAVMRATAAKAHEDHPGKECVVRVQSTDYGTMFLLVSDGKVRGYAPEDDTEPEVAVVEPAGDVPSEAPHDVPANDDADENVQTLAVPPAPEPSHPVLSEHSPTVAPAPAAPSARVENPFTATFIEPHRASPPQIKPASGFASVLASFGIGGSSSTQQAEAADQFAVSTVWTQPKTIAVANGKGGSGKTPTTIYLASMFAREGGGMVLAYDNNTFRGALGWQTENAEHHATIDDLMNALPSLDPAMMRAADISRFTHHQTDDRFDVLQSRPQKLAVDQRLSDEEFDAIHEVVRRYYRLTVMDSGNDESAANWLAMIRHSDALVVPTATTPKHCESARLLLSALTEQGGHSAQLARDAVIVVSHASPHEPPPSSVMPMFAGMAREVLAIPHDPAMGKSWLTWADLDAKTQRAWLAVGAAVARVLSD